MSRRRELALRYTVGALDRIIQRINLGAIPDWYVREGNLVPLIYGQWTFHLLRSEHKLALAEQIKKIGEERNDVTVQLQGRLANGQTRCCLGEFVAARTLPEQCHGLGDPAHRSIGGELDPYATMLAWIALTLAALGYLDQAQLRLNEALSEARRLRHAQTPAEVLSCASWVELMTRSPEVQQHAEELMALSTELGFAWYFGHATVIRGLLLGAVRGLVGIESGVVSGLQNPTASALERRVETTP